MKLVVAARDRICRELRMHPGFYALGHTADQIDRLANKNLLDLASKLGVDVSASLPRFRSKAGATKASTKTRRRPSGSWSALAARSMICQNLWAGMGDVTIGSSSDWCTRGQR
jgi:hypothetical protein